VGRPGTPIEFRPPRGIASFVVFRLIGAMWHQPVVMGAATQIFSKMSGKHLGGPHLCLTLAFELTMATGLGEHGHPIRMPKSDLCDFPCDFSEGA
jgi:hypothetical protein